MKTNKGRKLMSGTVVLKGSTTPKMRCPKCNAIAAATTSSQGKPIYQCGGCGSSFGSSKF